MMGQVEDAGACEGPSGAGATVLLMVGASQRGPTGEVAYTLDPGDDRSVA